MHVIEGIFIIFELAPRVARLCVYRSLPLWVVDAPHQLSRCLPAPSVSGDSFVYLCIHSAGAEQPCLPPRVSSLASFLGLVMSDNVNDLQ